MFQRCCGCWMRYGRMDTWSDQPHFLATAPNPVDPNSPAVGFDLGDSLTPSLHHLANEIRAFVLFLFTHRHKQTKPPRTKKKPPCGGSQLAGIHTRQYFE